MHKLTAIIPCKNERLNIRPCIESLRGLADEILVADSGSTDGTLDIVREIGGCRVIEREYRHSGDFKNWAIPQAAHEWVLIVDADERVPPTLADEIRQTLLQPRCDGYWIYRANHFMGHRVRFGPWGSNKVLRLFRRDMGRYVGENDHAEVQVGRGSVGRLRSRLVHFTFWTYDQYFHKIQRYSSYQARAWHAAGKSPSLLRLHLTMLARFLQTYVLRLGFLDGVVGFQVCMMIAFYSYWKQARLWELHCAIPQPDPESGRQSTATALTIEGRHAA